MILTGTPSANRPFDIWSQIYFLDGGESLGSNYIDFKNATDIDFVADGGDRIKYEEELRKINHKISDFTVRETKDSGIIDLPHKRIFKIECEWERYQWDKYEQTRIECSTVIIQEGIPLEDDSTPILKRLTRLIQIASNPALIDDSYTRTPGKVSTLRNLVDQIVDRNEKVIIWSSFNKNITYLKNELLEYGCRTVFGKMGIEERYLSINDFKNKKEVKVLIATPGTAKEGLTLTVANNVIFYDRTFSLDDYLQAQDRIHRLTQNKECNVYNLILPNSIDEWIEELLIAKSLAARFSQGDIASDYFRTRMNYNFKDSLRRILGIND